MYKIEFSEYAKHDIEEIIFYIKYTLKNHSAAKKLYKKFQNIVSLILTFPYGEDEIIFKNLKNSYRKINVNNYQFFYTIDEKNKKILIVRVLHSKRNIENIKGM